MGPVLSSECVTNCTFNLSNSDDDILTFAALLLNLDRNLFQSLVLGRWSIVCLSYELGGVRPIDDDDDDVSLFLNAHSHVSESRESVLERISSSFTSEAEACVTADNIIGVS